MKVGYTAPSVDGQAEVIQRALARAGVHPQEISLIEAHGTGTELGDPIEVAALRQAFGSVPKKGFCALGSVKTNIGHVDAAAGAASFIKTVLAIEHEFLPPSLHFERPNPRIDFENSPFYVNARPSPWENGGAPRRAGVSSFGIGGTNAHVVVEQAPANQDSGPSRSRQLLVLSARTSSALEAVSANLARHLKSHPDVKLADAAYTLQVGRRAFRHRRFLLGEDRNQALEALEARDSGGVASAVAERDDRPVAFMFPGQGAQHAGMGRELYDDEPVFRDAVDRCCELLEPQLGADLREVIPLGSGAQGRTRRSAPPTVLDETRITQPALFVVEYALARLWTSWGIEPQAMIGHSIGEYVAACLAGVFSLENALALVAARGRLMQGLPGGAMLAVLAPAGEIRRHLGPRLSLAAINEPGRSVVSGPTEAVDDFERRLAGEGIAGRRLRTSHAFHSEMMDPILDEFEAEVRRAAPRSPRIPFVSNLTGTWITAEQASDPTYWTRHLRQTVELSRGIGELVKDPTRVLLEVGPGQGLSRAARRRRDRPAELAVFPSLARSRAAGAGGASVLETLGRLWLAGVRVDWAGFYAHERRRRIPLPTYPFERKRYWIERAGAEERREAAAARLRTPEVPIASKMPEAALGKMPEAALGKMPEDAPGRRKPASALERIVEQQLQTISRQLEITSAQLELLRRARNRSSGRALPEVSRPLSQSPSRLCAEPPVASEPARDDRLLGELAAGDAAAEEASAPLTPIQHWFFERRPAAPEHFTMARLFEVSSDPELIAKALQCLPEHHDALRLRFHRDSSGWRQTCVAGEAQVPLPWIDLARLTDRDQAPAVAGAAAALRASLNLSRGPLLRTGFFALGRQRPGRLLIAIHHLAVDVTSWRILLEDLETACRQLEPDSQAPLALLPQSLEHESRRVTEDQRAEAHGDVDVFIAVDVPDPGAVGALDQDVVEKLFERQAKPGRGPVVRQDRAIFLGPALGFPGPSAEACDQGLEVLLLAGSQIVGSLLCGPVGDVGLGLRPPARSCGRPPWPRVARALKGRRCRSRGRPDRCRRFWSIYRGPRLAQQLQLLGGHLKLPVHDLNLTLDDRFDRLGLFGLAEAFFLRYRNGRLGNWLPEGRGREIGRISGPASARRCSGCWRKKSIARLILTACRFFVCAPSDDKRTITCWRLRFTTAWPTGFPSGMVLQEIAACYSAACQGRRCRLPDSTSFREFAGWQRRWLESPEMAQAEAFWLAQFADSVPVLELPTDRPRPPVKTYAGSSLNTTIGTPLAEALRKTGRDYGSTTFVILVGAVQLFLHRLSGQVLAFTLGVSVAAGIIFGLAPALQASRTDLVLALKSDSGAERIRRWGLSRLLVIVQVAVSLVLLISAGLFLRSLRSAQSVDLGMDPRNVLALDIDLDMRGYSEDDGRRFFRELVERVKNLPGVEAASLARPVPMTWSVSATDVAREGEELLEDRQQLLTLFSIVGEDYFATLSTPLVRGRGFEQRDDEDQPLGIVVNETLAQRLWPGADPLGKRVRLSALDGEIATVIGVAGDGKYRLLAEDPQPYLYLPFRQLYQAATTLVVRTTADPNAMLETVRREIHALDGDLALIAQPLETLISDRLLMPLRLVAGIAGAFGLLGTLLAGVGLYGIMSHAVSQRTREIGMRMALGAEAGDVLTLVLRQAMLLTLIGLGIGLVLAWAFTRLLSNLLVGVSHLDPLIFAAMSAGLIAVASAASFFPARRAIRIDPSTSLRAE